MADERQNFLGGLIGGAIVKKGIEVGLDMALKKAAASKSISLQPSDVPAVKEIVTKSVEREVQARVDHVTDNEPAYSSRNMWGALVGIITAADLMQRMWFDGLPNTATDYLTPLGIIIASLTPIYSRYIAKKPLGQ